MQHHELLLLSLALLAPASGAQGISKLSVAPGGTPTNGSSSVCLGPDSITPDGRYVLFTSTATNFVPADTNGYRDAFRLDRTTGSIVRVSVGNGGTQLNESTPDAAISDDGRFVAFVTAATNIVPNDAPLTLDVFRRDLLTGSTELVSATVSGGPCDLTASMPSISADGSRIAFSSDSAQLIPFDGNGRIDIFVRDMNLGTTWRVSRLPSSFGANQDCRFPALSGDGQFVVFESTASNFGPPPGTQHIFLALVPTGVIEEVSVGPGGVSGNGWSSFASISHDGNRIAFLSQASNFEPVGGPLRDLPFLRDRAAGTTRLIARQPNGQPMESDTQILTLSNDGRFAAFSSESALLTPGHTGTVADAFVVDVDSLETVRASTPLGGSGEPNEPVFNVRAISDSGADTVYSTLASNLVAGDPQDGLFDVYLFDRAQVWHPDADGDGFGNASVSTISLPPAPPGHVSDSTDCDDTNAAVHPGAAEICNGLDDDCNGTSDPGASVRYCATATSQLGCVPRMSASGFVSASATSGFILSASQLPGARQAALLHGLGATQISFAFGSASSICVQAPRVRTLLTSTGGTAGACDGTLSLDWLAWMAAHPGALGHPLAPGQILFAQVWYRDPGAVLDANTTDALQFGICP